MGEAHALVSALQCHAKVFGDFKDETKRNFIFFSSLAPGVPTLQRQVSHHGANVSVKSTCSSMEELCANRSFTPMSVKKHGMHAYVA